MKNLLFICLLFCSSVFSIYSQSSSYIPEEHQQKKILQHIKFGIVGTYSINHLKKPNNLWIKYGLFHDANIGFNALYEYRKGVYFKTGVSLKQYRLTTLTADADPRLQIPYNIKNQLNYLSFDAGFLFDIRKTKTGIGLTYYLERYLSQRNNYPPERRVDWHYYIAYHHILSLSYYYHPVPSFFVSFDVKSSVSALGLAAGNPPIVFNDKFLVFGLCVSARYYFVRRRK